MYVPSTEQLVYEFEVADIPRAVSFYERLGFEALRTEPLFAELTWEGHRLFLAADGNPDVRPKSGHLRIMVPDVDRRHAEVQRLGVDIVRALRDTSYGLRDFIFRDPDGNQLRFGTFLRDLAP